MLGRRFEYCAQRFNLNGIAHRRPGAVRFNVTDRFDRNSRASLGQSNGFGLPFHAGRKKRRGPGAVAVLRATADHCVNRVPVGQRVFQPLEHHDAGSVAEHGARGIRIEGTAMSVLGKRAAFLVEKAALLRHADINASGQSHVAFEVEQARESRNQS